MKLRELTETDRSIYSEFVRSHGSFLQSWDWGEFQKSLGRQVFRYVLEENGLVLACQVLKYAELGKSYLSASYGPVGPSVDFEKLQFFLDEIEKLHPDSVFIRVEPQYLFKKAENRSWIKSTDLNPHQTWVLDLGPDPETLLAGMHPKTRYNIRLAEKKGVVLEVRTELKDAGKLFLSTAKRGGFKSFSENYYDSLLSFFASGDKEIQVKLYAAYHEGDLLAANVMVFWERSAIYLFGASADFKRNLMAPYLIHWRAIQDTKREGRLLYDFWGVEQDPNHPWYGFSKFKISFGGRLVGYAGTWDYVYRRAWYNAYTVLRALNRAIKR